MSRRYTSQPQSQSGFDRDVTVGVRIEVFNPNPLTLKCLEDIVSRIKSLEDYEVIDERRFDRAVYIYLIHKKAKKVLEEKTKLLEKLLEEVAQESESGS